MIPYEAAYLAATPLHDKVGLNFTVAEEDGEVDPKLYQNIFESHMYIALSTSPDVSFTATALPLYNSMPSAKHIPAVQWVLQYLNATKYYLLHYNSSSTSQSHDVGYTHSKWASGSAD